MRPLILAAGLGRRMRPLSGASHKTLLPLDDRQTILSRILRGLVDEGFREATIVTGYRAEEVQQHALAVAPEIAFTFIQNTRYAETNNIQSVALAFRECDMSDGIILIESDLVYEPAVMRRLLQAPQPNVALLDRYRPGMDGTVVELDPHGTIERIIPTQQQGSDFDFSTRFKTLNLYKFSPEFCSGPFPRLLDFYSQQVNDNCYYELILGMLIAASAVRIHGEVLENELWAEVDDPIDLHQAEFLVARPRRAELLQRTWGGWWGLPMVDFAFIRNMHFPTDSVLAELRLQLPQLVHSYGSAQAILDRKLAWFLEVPPSSVVALNGASQAFPLLAASFPGRPTYVPHPTFGEWRRAFPEGLAYADDGSGRFPGPLPAGAILVAVNPNNPTGTVFPTDTLERLAAQRPDVLVLVDESFIDFSGQESLVGCPLQNIVVLKSLSKSLGAPGLRVGALYSANLGIAGQVRDSLPIWNLNSVAEKFLELLLKNREVIDASYAASVNDRQDLVMRLEGSQLVERVWPSGGNFVLARLRTGRQEASQLQQLLMSDHGLLVKDVSGRLPGDRGHWRVAVRVPNDHLQLVAAMQELEEGRPHDDR